MVVLARPLIVVAAIAVHVAGCAERDEPGSPGEADTAAATETAGPGDTSAAAPALTSVPLPASLPADFPVPPQSTVTSAEADSAADGTFTNVTIMSQGDPEAGYAWYREALTRGGWTVTTEGTSDGTRTLHAELGESYVDLVVAGDSAPGWTRSDAAIWKIHP